MICVEGAERYNNLHSVAIDEVREAVGDDVEKTKS
jgi:hypothetical protein